MVTEDLDPNERWTDLYRLLDRQGKRGVGDALPRAPRLHTARCAPYRRVPPPRARAAQPCGAVRAPCPRHRRCAAPRAPGPRHMRAAGTALLPIHARARARATHGAAARRA